MLHAPDELHDDSWVSEPDVRTARRALPRSDSCSSLLFCVGQFRLVSMALDSLRVARDDNVEGVPFPGEAPDGVSRHPASRQLLHARHQSTTFQCLTVLP